jgi:hypothetical protein
VVLVYVTAEGVLPALVESIAGSALRGAITQGNIPAPNVMAAAYKMAAIK